MYHSTLGLRVVKKKRSNTVGIWGVSPDKVSDFRVVSENQFEARCEAALVKPERENHTDKGWCSSEYSLPYEIAVILSQLRLRLQFLTGLHTIHIHQKLVDLLDLEGHVGISLHPNPGWGTDPFPAPTLLLAPIQGYLAHKKPSPSRTLQ